MERVRGARAVRRGIGQSIDDLQLLDDRARPSVIDDERQRVFMLRANVDEVDVQPVDLGDELRQGVQPRLARAPVVVRHPVARELLDHGERHALGLIGDGLLLGPVRGRDASTKVVQMPHPERRRGRDGSRWRSRRVLLMTTLLWSVSAVSGTQPAPRSEKSSGSSQAAKWPPLSTSLK